jgi:N-acetylglucosaminyldiphosphoundecaprenol N-acetyl-beta-D-mannosaminyltransferase
MPPVVTPAPDSGFRLAGALGTPLLLTSYAELTRQLQQISTSTHSVAVDFTNTQIVTCRRHDPSFREITSQVDFFVPDGMPLIWCLNAQGARLRDRVYGPTFMRFCIGNSPPEYTHYLLGGSEECLKRLKASLMRQNPAVRIVGSHSGYFGPDAEPAILEEINRTAPDFIWVGLGTPKQQAWIHKYKQQINRGIILAVGFAFDVNAGTKPDAPPWMQRYGLTWVFRLLSEPRRLGPRYVRWNFLFLFYLLWDGLRGRAWARS